MNLTSAQIPWPACLPGHMCCVRAALLRAEFARRHQKTTLSRERDFYLSPRAAQIVFLEILYMYARDVVCYHLYNSVEN